jgi:E3 ubiquitin-protein ligase RNF14
MADLDALDEREEELSTLQSIYPELIIDAGHPPTAHIDLLVAPITPLPVVFDPEQTTHRLSYLPPLVLDIILAEGYPAERAPVFHLVTSPPWIPDYILQKLETEGQSLWEEYGGMQMLFAYVSYLQEAAETAFGVANASADGTVKLAEGLGPALLGYNSKMMRDIFEKETFDCTVCLEPKKGSACYRLQRCSHVFCKECLQDFYGNCIKEGDVNNVKCMSPDCGKTGDIKADRRKKDRLLSPKELLQIPLPLDTVKRFAQIKRKKKIEADPTIVFCPRSWCQGAMRTEKYPKITDVSKMDESDAEDDEPAPPPEEKEPDMNEKPKGSAETDRLVICEDCSLAFCKVCLASWHGDFKRCVSREVQDLTEEEQASLNYILLNTSPCPECSVPCQKAYGCNHMTCFQCKTHFCYICGAWLAPDDPYRHFNDKKFKKCYQRLMDGAMGDEGNGQIRFAGRRGAEQEAEFWEQEAMRIQMEEMNAVQGT